MLAGGSALRRPYFASGSIKWLGTLENTSSSSECWMQSHHAIQLLTVHHHTVSTHSHQAHMQMLIATLYRDTWKVQTTQISTSWRIENMDLCKLSITWMDKNIMELKGIRLKRAHFVWCLFYEMSAEIESRLRTWMPLLFLLLLLLLLHFLLRQALST